MTLEALQALGAHDEVGPIATTPPAAAAAAGAGSFALQVGEGLQQLNQQLLANQVDLQRLAAGDADNLHEIMVRLEESRIALQFALQVRNRVLEAYQDVMRMQI